MTQSAGKMFREAVIAQQPLSIVGTINAYTALLAEHAGHHAIYCSGAGVANASYGMPDLGVTTLDNVLEDVRRITQASSLPLLVDIDTGWEEQDGGIAHTIKSMISAGVGAVHVEDQVSAKRCGHRPNKQLVSLTAMQDRIKAVSDGKTDDSFVIMARTDALASEGMDSAIERATAYVEAGADMLFFEAATSIDDYATFCTAVSVPVLANCTEFGKTPIIDRAQLAQAGVAMVLYPLTAFRAMSHAAETVYQTLIEQGTQNTLLDRMQTRDQLYQHLDYETFEHQQDEQYQGEQHE